MMTSATEVGLPMPRTDTPLQPLQPHRIAVRAVSFRPCPEATQLIALCPPTMGQTGSHAISDQQHLIGTGPRGSSAFIFDEWLLHV